MYVCMCVCVCVCGGGGGRGGCVFMCERIERVRGTMIMMRVAEKRGVGVGKEKRRSSSVETNDRTRESKHD